MPSSAVEKHLGIIAHLTRRNIVKPQIGPKPSLYGRWASIVMQACVGLIGGPRCHGAGTEANRDRPSITLFFLTRITPDVATMLVFCNDRFSLQSPLKKNLVKKQAPKSY